MKERTCARVPFVLNDKNAGMRMVSVREATWWNECVRTLRAEPLTIVAAQFRVDQATLAEALGVESAGMPAERSVWWPEALRMLGVVSIRAIARLFHTEPRRIRRALARLNLRVGGRDVVEDAGVAQLAGLRDMFGREPDRVVARMAGVIPEAVQGERKRLRIPAYVQRRRVRLSREDEAWIRGPKRGHRAKVHVEENLQVVRRPTRTDENAHRPSGWGVGHADPKPRTSGEFVARPPRLDREFFRSQAPEELERLLLPVRQRDGRQRLVRGESLRGADSLAPVADSGLRKVASPTVVRRESMPTLGERPSVSHRQPSGEAERLPPVPVLIRGAANAAPIEPRPLLPRAQPRRAEASPNPASPAVAPAPSAFAVAPPLPYGAGLVVPAPPVVAMPAAVTPPPAPPSPRAVVTNDEWLVYVPGNDTPLRLYAPDIVQAIAAASRIVPADLLRLASVWRADEV